MSTPSWIGRNLARVRGAGADATPRPGKQRPGLRLTRYAGLLAGLLLFGVGVARAADTESLSPDRRDLLDKAARQFWPQRPGATDVYFVGFAGDGAQRVFRREALTAERMFGWRMGTATRALQLINDRDDHESFAVADATGLRYALARVAAAMDPKNDMLVLWLTSHGSSDGSLHVFNDTPRIDVPLPPSEVRSVLDDSGIRWRIVIVSACFSGAFIEPLKSDNTAIITAADATHTSFGCADNRELTYFGEAFLRDALPKATSLQSAFEQACQEIAQREAAERIPASNPQMWVGASMAQKLTKLGDFPLPAE